MKLATQLQASRCSQILLKIRAGAVWPSSFAGIAPFLGVLALLLSAPAQAQTNLVDRLPANTWAYMSWGGSTSLKPVSGTNSELRAWNDPALRTFLENAIGTVSHEGGPAQKSVVTPGRIAQIFSALENPIVLGLVANESENLADRMHNPVGFFLIYDASGKQELLDQLRRERDANSTRPVQRSSLTVGDIAVEKRAYADSASFEAQIGSYFVLTQSLETMEQLLPRLRIGRAAVAPFRQSADFPAECRELSQSSALDIVVLPTRFHIPNAAANAGFDFHAFSTSLHLDRIRAGCMGVTFERQMTRMHGLVLGDTSEGSLLNALGSERESFATLPLASSNSSFHVSVLDFAGLYNSLFNAISAALPSGKAPFVAAMTAFLSSSWGMPPDQFLALFTGEVATIHPDTAVDPSETLYALTIRNPEKVTHVLQNLIPGEKASADQEGDVTYVTIQMVSSLGGKSAAPDPAPGYAAVTPNMLLVSKQERVVRDGVARLHAAPNDTQGGMLSSDPEFQKARATLPAKLDSFTYINYSRYNWRKVMADAAKYIQDRAQQAAHASGKPAPVSAQQLQQLLQEFDPSLVARYLHVSVGGAWKDANGIHFESTIQ